MDPEPFGHGLGVDQDAISHSEHEVLQATVEPRSQVPEIALAGDNRRHAGQARSHAAHDVAVEVERVDEVDPRVAEVSRKPADASENTEGFERASTTTPRSNAGRLEPRAQRPFGANAAHVDVPHRSIQSGGELHELPFGPAQTERVTHQKDRGPARAPAPAREVWKRLVLAHWISSSALRPARPLRHRPR